METKKKFYVNSYHSVYIDSYENGEQNCVNSYNLHKIIKADNFNQAIEFYFSDFLYYNFDIKFADICDNTLHYSVLVDVENIEAKEKDIEKWKKDLIKLYSNNICLQCFELVNCLND